MNILLLAAGQNIVDEQNEAYPLPLVEFDGTPLIQHLINACQLTMGKDVQLIIALRSSDVRYYYLDNIIHLLAPDAKILQVGNNTKGAACTALLAVPYIDNTDELLILNINELLDIDLSLPIKSFKERSLDAGVVSFNSIHPRYSYVSLKDNLVVEAAEKRPISQYATVGYYWFKNGKDFVDATKKMIRKDASLNGLFYICPVLNELVLVHKEIGIYQIDKNLYHPIKNEKQLEQLEAFIERKNS